MSFRRKKRQEERKWENASLTPWVIFHKGNKVIFFINEIKLKEKCFLPQNLDTLFSVFSFSFPQIIALSFFLKRFSISLPNHDAALGLSPSETPFIFPDDLVLVLYHCIGVLTGPRVWRRFARHRAPQQSTWRRRRHQLVFMG